MSFLGQIVASYPRLGARWWYSKDVQAPHPARRDLWLSGNPKGGKNRDLDLAIAGTHPLTFDEKTTLAQDLSPLTGKEVDLWVDLLKRHLFDEADFTPLRELHLKAKRERFIKEWPNPLAPSRKLKLFQKS